MQWSQGHKKGFTKQIAILDELGTLSYIQPGAMSGLHEEIHTNACAFAGMWEAPPLVWPRLSLLTPVLAPEDNWIEVPCQSFCW